MTSGAGFLQIVECGRCGQKMSPANIGKHEPACAERDKFSHLFNEPISTRQMKSFRRNLELYGMEIKDYESLFVAQNGVCAICNKTNKRRRRLAVDHCHESDVVRGLLCDPCNQIIGMAGENPTTLRSAAAYVSAHKAAISEAA